MASIDWASVHRFYSEVWGDMPFKSQVEAQEFMDLAASKMRYEIWRGVFSPLPGWMQSVTNENVWLHF